VVSYAIYWWGNRSLTPIFAREHGTFPPRYCNRRLMGRQHPYVRLSESWIDVGAIQRKLNTVILPPLIISLPDGCALGWRLNLLSFEAAICL
jgi:hypothetical protein